MCQSCSSSTSSAALMSSLVKAADQDAGKAAKLLKKAMTADEQMVAKLLPTIPHDGSLDVAA